MDSNNGSSNQFSYLTLKAPFFFPDTKQFGMFAGQCLEVLALSEPKIFDSIKKFDCCPEAIERFDLIFATGQTPLIKATCNYCGHIADSFALTAVGYVFCCADDDCLATLQGQYREHSLYDLKISSVYMFEDYRKQVMGIMRTAFGLPQKISPIAAFNFFKASCEKNILVPA